MSTRSFQPADHLHSRTFIGLLIAQFFAAFNDQAIHASAMFFAINTETMGEADAITLMPILFYAPWAIFCTVAGYLADRYSKRFSLVLWKVIEIGITLLALTGFWLGRHGFPAPGAYLVLSTVFLMGMHSAFFVPAKYGAMPEILTPRMLSRGNGVLESLSFLAVILGTVAGGVLSTQFKGHEFLIGVVLTVLAVIGALASFFIEGAPAANPNRPFPAYIYKPIVENIRVLLTSRPLVFAVIGIAFFTFLVAYMRQVVYMHGQSQLPTWSEAHTSYIVGMVALGIGIGSPLVGYLSGGKVEIGLVPIGAVGMMLATTVAGLFLDRAAVLIACIILIGFFTGFYLVPLFTLLQHRAPRASKGDSIATSNFINITGAIAASVVFRAVIWWAIATGYTPDMVKIGERQGVLDGPPQRDDEGRAVVVSVGKKEFQASYHHPPYVRLRLRKGLVPGQEVVVRTFSSRNQKGEEVIVVVVRRASDPPRVQHNMAHLPSLLFFSTGAMTLFTLGLLWWVLPDIFRRAWLWMRAQGRYRMELAGMLRLPGSGPAILVTDAGDAEARSHVERAADRVVHFLLPKPGDDIEALVRTGRDVLARRDVLGLSLPAGADSAAEHLTRELLVAHAPILPVHHDEAERNGKRCVYVVAGLLLEPGTSVDQVREQLRQVAADIVDQVATGEALEKEAIEH
jgi:MFS family permease